MSALLLGIGIPLAYVIIAMVAGILIYRRNISIDAEEELEARERRWLEIGYRFGEDLPLINDLNRIDATAQGWLFGIFWPLLPIVVLIFAVTGRFASDYVTPAERIVADRQELARLRKQAKELGLPMPEEPK